MFQEKSRIEIINGLNHFNMEILHIGTGLKPVPMCLNDKCHIHFNRFLGYTKIILGAAIFEFLTRRNQISLTYNIFEA